MTFSCGIAGPQPTSEVFLPADVSQGVSRRCLVCVPLIPHQQWQLRHVVSEWEVALLLQKVLCGSMYFSALWGHGSHHYTASGWCHPLCPKADTDPFFKISLHIQEQVLTLNITSFCTASGITKRKHIPKSLYRWQLYILMRSAIGHISPQLLEQNFPPDSHSLHLL